MIHDDHQILFKILAGLDVDHICQMCIDDDLIIQIVPFLFFYTDTDIYLFVVDSELVSFVNLLLMYNYY